MNIANANEHFEGKELEEKLLKSKLKQCEKPIDNTSEPKYFDKEWDKIYQ